MFLYFAEGNLDIDRIIEAVVKNGADRWFEIGWQLGMSHVQVKTTTSHIPSCTLKLRHIIDSKRAEVGNAALAEKLLDACRQISRPIIGAVQEELSE